MGGKRGKGLVNNFNFTPYLSVRTQARANFLYSKSFYLKPLHID